MKKIAFIAAAVFFLACLTANAQMSQGDDWQSGQQYTGMHGRMKGGGMCPMQHGMMGSGPMHKYKMMVHMLPGLQDPLSLTPEQTEKLIDLQTSFKKQQVDYKAKLAKEKIKVQTLMENNAAADKIKSQLKTCADIKINMQAAAYETGTEMKAVLTNDQSQMLEEMMPQSGHTGQHGRMPGHGGMKKRMMHN
ncbi:MAG: Spy/CpxP family protein refolding chaperone [Desulfosalsimonas sp.]